MLFVLPFVIVALTITSYYHSSSALFVGQERGGYLTFLSTLSPFWQLFLGTIVLMGMAGMIFFINERYKLLQQSTTLPILLYILLIAWGINSAGMGYALIASLVFALALDRLQVAITNLKSNGVLFEFGVLSMLAVLIYPKFVLLLAWAICATLFSGRSTLKDITALVLGFILPLIFLVFYYFWGNRLGELPEIFVQNLLSGDFISLFSVWEWVRLGSLLFILCISLLHFLARSSALVLIHRRFFFALLSLFFFLAVTFFIIPFDDKSLMYLCALPLAFLYAHFFLVQRSVIIVNVVFFWLLAACFLPFFI